MANLPQTDYCCLNLLCDSWTWVSLNPPFFWPWTANTCRMHLSQLKHTGPFSLTVPCKFNPKGSYQTTCRRHRWCCTDDSSFCLVCTKVDNVYSVGDGWVSVQPWVMLQGSGCAFKSHGLWGQAPAWSCLSLAQSCLKHHHCFWKMQLGDETFTTDSCQLIPRHTNILQCDILATPFFKLLPVAK